MTINTVDYNNPISIEDARVMIRELGPEGTVFVLKGEPGIGKSTLLKMLEEDMGDKYDYIYVDCPVKDIGDTAMSIPDTDRTRLKQIVSDLFKLDSAKPKVIMLDEFMKTPKLLQIMWTRLMLEKCIGDHKLPVGSIIFATSNHSSDGVGDTMLEHAGNRVTICNMRKPTATEWNTWATNAGIAAEIRACVAMHPRLMASYLDGGQEDNPYIFKPRQKIMSFASPRSLAKCDPIIKKRHVMGVHRTQASLAGTIGAAAAELLSAMTTLAGELVSIKDTLADPDNVRMPEKPAALIMMMFNAIDTVQTQDELAAFMRFVNRIQSSEVQSIFFTMALQSKKTAKLAIHNEQIKSWAKDNYQLMI